MGPPVPLPSKCSVIPVGILRGVLHVVGEALLFHIQFSLLLTVTAILCCSPWNSLLMADPKHYFQLQPNVSHH